MYTVFNIAKLLNGDVVGSKKNPIVGICELSRIKKNHISFLLDNNKNKLLNDKVHNLSALVVSHHFDESINTTLIKVDNPKVSFIKVLNLFNKRKEYKPGIHKTCIIDKTSVISKTAFLGPQVIVGKNVIIKSNVSIAAKVIIEDNVTIGAKTQINNNVVIHSFTDIGSNVIIDAGSVIGSTGFGIANDKGFLKNVPHIGSTIILDNVWIGSNCCIDRGTIGNTTIGANTKIDNLVQIGHNVTIGKSCVIAAQVGIAGSSKIGNDVVIGGQSGIRDHIKIGNKCIIASKTAVMKSLAKNSVVSGIPAFNHMQKMRSDILIKELPNIYKAFKKNNQNE